MWISCVLRWRACAWVCLNSGLSHLACFAGTWGGLSHSWKWKKANNQEPFLTRRSRKGMLSSQRREGFCLHSKSFSRPSLFEGELRWDGENTSHAFPSLASRILNLERQAQSPTTIHMKPHTPRWQLSGQRRDDARILSARGKLGSCTVRTSEWCLHLRKLNASAPPDPFCWISSFFKGATFPSSDSVPTWGHRALASTNYQFQPSDANVRQRAHTQKELTWP